MSARNNALRRLVSDALAPRPDPLVITPSLDGGAVVLDLSRPTTSARLHPEAARTLARHLLELANFADGIDAGLLRLTDEERRELEAVTVDLGATEADPDAPTPRRSSTGGRPTVRDRLTAAASEAILSDLLAKTIDGTLRWRRDSLIASAVHGELSIGIGPTVVGNSPVHSFVLRVFHMRASRRQSWEIPPLEAASALWAAIVQRTPSMARETAEDLSSADVLAALKGGAGV